MPIATTVEYTTRPCMWCGKATTMTLDADSLGRYRRGALVQDAFPDMAPPTREMLITGTHPTCWDAMFGDEDE